MFEYKDYRVTEQINQYLIGAVIIDSFVISGGHEADRNVMVIFEKENKRGCIVIGYNELGEWIDYLYYGKQVIINFIRGLYSNEEMMRFDKIIQEYDI